MVRRVQSLYRYYPTIVIPAKAGIQLPSVCKGKLGPRLRGGDGKEGEWREKTPKTKERSDLCNTLPTLTKAKPGFGLMNH